MSKIFAVLSSLLTILLPILAPGGEKIKPGVIGREGDGAGEMTDAEAVSLLKQYRVRGSDNFANF